MAELPLWKSLVHMFLMVPRYLLARSSSTNIAISNHVLRRQNLPKSKTIYYGIEDRLSFAERAPQENSGAMCFAYVGRLSPEKGVPIFLKAISLLKKEGLDFKVKLVGDGTQRAEIEKILHSEAIADRVVMTGFLNGDALSRVMENVSAVVMPSVCEETAGLAAIEQMMRGRLVIASDIGGLAEVVGNAGFLSPAGNAEALAGRMKEVIQNPELIEILGKIARARALELFQSCRMVEEHATVYRQLVQP
jgi:glycosyltransferase involved in cell wall biosynthesis